MSIHFNPNPEKVDIEKYNDHVYLNLTITNKYPTNTSVYAPSIPVNFNVQRSEAILDNMKLYYLSIIRFSMSLNEIPLGFYPNPNIYYVGLYYNDVYYREPVPFVSQTAHSTRLLGVAPEYANAIWNYHDLLNPINQAYQTCFNRLVTDNPTNQLQAPPKLELDPFTKKGIFYVPQSYIANKCSVTASRPLTKDYINLFDFSNAVIAPGGVVDTNYDYSIIVPTLIDSAKYTVVSNSITYVVVYSSANMYAFMNKLEFIQVQSNNLGCLFEYVDDGTNRSNIITDYLVPQQEMDWSNVIYQPSVYRYSDMISDHPLYNFNINVYLRYRGNLLVQLLLEVGETFNMKMMFIKKSLITHNP